jgi:hypothetical protein
VPVNLHGAFFFGRMLPADVVFFCITCFLLFYFLFYVAFCFPNRLPQPPVYIFGILLMSFTKKKEKKNRSNCKHATVSSAYMVAHQRPKLYFFQIRFPMHRFLSFFDSFFILVCAPLLFCFVSCCFSIGCSSRLLASASANLIHAIKAP